jgi:hypothetical protein
VEDGLEKHEPHAFKNQKFSHKEMETPALATVIKLQKEVWMKG